MAYPVSTSPFLGTSASPAYTGVFIPTLWSGKLVEKFYAATVLGAISNTDYEGEIRNQGDTVKIRTKPTISIAAYEADQALAVQRPSSNVIDLLIDKGKYFNLVLDDVFEIQSDLDLMGLWADDAAEQFKISIDTEVLNYLGTTTDIAATNRGATAGALTASINLGAVATPRTVDASTNSIVNFLVDCGQVLDEANIPETGRFVVLPAWAVAFIKKSELRDASISGDTTSILRNGRVGMIDRFTVYMSNLITPLGAGTDEYPVLFGVNDGLTFASQFTKMETLRSESTFGTLMRGLQVYGYKVVNNVALGRAIIT
jgi:hypothetical protein